MEERVLTIWSASELFALSGRKATSLKKKRSDKLRSQSLKRSYFGLLVSFPFILAGQFVASVSTLVTLNVGSADEPLGWPLGALAALLDCCDP